MTHQPHAIGGFIRLDPTRRPVPAGVPDDLLTRWEEDRTAAAAERAELAASHAAQLLACRAEALRLRRLIGDAGSIGGDLRALLYLFDKALIEDGRDDELTAASHVVVGCLRTMATRLAALEEHAHTLSDAGGAS